ncbi:MAG: hypothetical protein WKG07_38475 [Hymenobacter sp.]
MPSPTPAPSPPTTTPFLQGRPHAEVPGRAGRRLPAQRWTCGLRCWMRNSIELQSPQPSYGLTDYKLYGQKGFTAGSLYGGQRLGRGRGSRPGPDLRVAARLRALQLTTWTARDPPPTTARTSTACAWAWPSPTSGPWPTTTASTCARASWPLPPPCA